MLRTAFKQIVSSPAFEPRLMAYQRPAADSVLLDFLRRSQRWSTERVLLPLRFRRTFWVLIPVELVWGIWLVTVVTGATRCDGPICSVATLDRHAGVLLVFAVLCLTGLIGLAPATRGLAQCNVREMAGLGVAAAAGGASLLGMVALLLGAVIVLMILAAFCAALSATA